MAEQYLNKEGVQTLWTAVKGKISTAQTTVENEFVNGTKKVKYAQQADNIGGVALSGLVQSIKVGSKTFSPKNSVVTLDNYALSTHTHTFASLTSKPTTISGYGITDAYTKTETDGKYATKATTLSGYGITDAYTKTESDGKYATKTDSDKKYQPKGSYATLGSDGKVPSSQLPSYVDDVIEGYYSNGNFYSDSAKTKKINGEGGKIYTDLTTNKTYRWGGTAWVEISASLAIGETAGTAYDGAKGAKNASDISLLKTDVSTLKTDNTQNKKDITNLKANVSGIQSQVDTNSNNIGLLNTDVITLKANVYTKTESDEKYVPARNEVNNISSIVLNENGEFWVQNRDTGVSATGTIRDLFVTNSGIGMTYGNYGILIDDHGPQMVINDDLYRFVLETDLPTLTDKVSTDTTGYQFSCYFIINNMKLEWGHVNSSAGNASVKVSVNFPSSFSGRPIVFLQTYNKTGNPSSEAESTTSQTQYRNAQSVRKVSSTGFMFDTGNSEAHGYSWIAIGRK